MPGWCPPRILLLGVSLTLGLLSGCGKEQKKPDEREAVEPAPPDIYPAPVSEDYFFDPVGKVREAANRTRSQNNLKQIGLAMLSYSDAMNGFPPIGFSQDMIQPLLSWRVAILPYVEEANLFNEFRLHEPWNSPHNKQLIPRMPKIYQLPGRQTVPGVTYYRVLMGDSHKIPAEAMPMFDKPIFGAIQPQPRINFVNIADGTSNTIMAFEAGEGIIWTKPEEMEYDPKQKIPPFGFIYGKMCNVLMADGSVRGMSRNIKESTLRGAITRAGGEPFGDDW